MLLDYATFRRGGRVSVWIGNFQTYEEVDEYMNLTDNFEKDFGFRLNERDMPESKVAESAESIEELVSGFSWYESFAPSVVEAAAKMNIAKATTMIVFLNYAFDPSKVAVNPKAPLIFLGNFPFS
jgi:hypothetical protein